MRWAVKESLDTTKWHKWWAWYPVKAGEYWVWLETVEQKQVFWWDGWDWYYRDT